MTKTGILYVISAALGCVAAIGIWAVSGFVLFAAGLSFYAPTAGLFLGLAVALVGGPLVYLRTRRFRPQSTKLVVAFLAGVLVFLLYGCVAVAIRSPHTVIFLQ
ncbi:hypothetical protein MSIMFB_03189 [Mycobacterium simulans]|uniref:Uncharacterized protein n=1 Tax=Mycobacterium simulans TaxID=627089 RepID=A0A7Z7NAH0_9MYCO|nr:hypothetical protein [Mycobacterium simulans]SOJ55708.1 hypothetical protein MSIMFB_03189 [Mycobacterium simulans]